MPNLKKAHIHVVRTKLWAALVVHRLGFSGSKKIESFICSSIDLKLDEPSGIFRQYISGRSMPSRSTGPAVEGVWLDRVDCVLPGTSDWFRSPVWFLLGERGPTYREIVECIRLLPDELQAEFLFNGKQHLPEQYQLHVPLENRVLLLGHPEDPWRLGSLACAYRVADLRGNQQVARRALLSLVQAVDDLYKMASKEKIRNVLLEFKALVGEHVCKYLAAIGGSNAPVELAEHMQEHSEFQAFDIRMDFAVRSWLRGIL